MGKPLGLKQNSSAETEKNISLMMDWLNEWR